MTQAQRDAYYSPGHWEKMLSELYDYHESVKLRYANGEITVGRFMQLGSSIYSSFYRFSRLRMIMLGHDNGVGKGKTLIINGINYGLMLEGAKYSTYRLADKINKEAGHIQDLTRKVSETFHASKDWIYDYSRRKKEYFGPWDIISVFASDTTERFREAAKIFYSRFAPRPVHVSYDKGSPDGDKTVLSVVGERGREIVELPDYKRGSKSFTEDHSGDAANYFTHGILRKGTPVHSPVPDSFLLPPYVTIKKEERVIRGGLDNTSPSGIEITDNE